MSPVLCISDRWNLNWEVDNSNSFPIVYRLAKNIQIQILSVVCINIHISSLEWKDKKYTYVQGDHLIKQ